MPKRGINHMLRSAALLLALLLLLSLSPMLASCAADRVEGLRVAVLDVGQSDAILLSQGEEHMLIDAGTATARGELLGALDTLGVKELSYLLLTHPHEDHVGNARAVLEQYPTGELLTSASVGEESAYLLALETAAERNCPHTVLQNGDCFSLGEATCEVLFASDKGEVTNNSSIVLRVQFGEKVFLFMGDAEGELEATLLYLYPAEKLDCDFLKVGHHGSRTSSTADFLAVTTPHFAAVSCGRDNDYGFPHDEVLGRYAALGTALGRTDLSGTLIYECDGKEIFYMEPKGYGRKEK